MTAPARLAAFGAALAVLFGGGALAGAAIGPDRDEPRTAHADADADARPAGAHGATRKEHGSAAQPVRGLAVAQDGLRIAVQDPELRLGRTEKVRFSVVDDRNAIVRDFDVQHDKRMHLIVARRDLNGFQHVHPEQQADGSWSVALRLGDAGSYRLFADFSHRDEAYTLAGDLRVDGNADLKPLRHPTRTSTSDGGYDVRFDTGGARPGHEANVSFKIAKDGRTVHTEPYLGAGGHLVALREGDLAFLHVHPTDGGHGGHGGHGGSEDSIGFAATFPTRGRYGLFLQFQHEGRVHTAAFSQEVR